MAYRAGIVGCGRIGCGFDDDPRRQQVSTHAGAYVQTPDVHLVALADVDEHKLDTYAGRFGVAGRYLDYGQMLAKERLDILSVCTWNDTHRAIIEEAVAAGVRAIFCEKPIADSLQNADAIIACCESSGALLLVNHKRRFDAFHQQLAAALQRGALGRIQQVTCYYTSGLANTGTHLIDLLRLYFGEVVAVQGARSASRSPIPSDPNLDGWLWFAQGFPATLQACDVSAYYLLEIHILGTAGRWVVLSGTSDSLRCESARSSPQASEYAELAPTPAPFEVGRPREYMLQGVRHLVECLQTHRLPLCGGAEGRKALEVICALRESAADGSRRVTLPLADSGIHIRSR